MIQKSLEVLESLIRGQELTSVELDQLLTNKIPEDLHLEYKHGDELKEKKEASRTIRQYLSGFANSAGGVLIVGVNQATWSVTGCVAPGGGDLAEWAARCLTPIASYLSPPPRLSVIRHAGGNLLVAAIDRSLGLVPCVEEGKLAYYFRIHDQTLLAPEYLISDLILGRRQHPYLRIASIALSIVNTKQEVSGAYDLKFYLQFVIENESLAWAEGVRLGIVSRTKHVRNDALRVSDHLLSYVEICDIEGRGYSGDQEISHVIADVKEIEPFRIAVFEIPELTVPLRVHDHWFAPYIWKAAIYLMPKGSPPVWYQLDLTIDSDLLTFLTSNTNVPFEAGFLAFQRLSGARPTIAWEWK